MSSFPVEPECRAIFAFNITPKPAIASFAQSRFDFAEEVVGRAGAAELLQQEEIGAVDVTLPQLDAQIQIAQVRVERRGIAIDPPVIAGQAIAPPGDEAGKAGGDVGGEALVDLWAAPPAVQIRQGRQVVRLEILDAKVAGTTQIDDRVELLAEDDEALIEVEQLAQAASERSQQPAHPVHLDVETNPDQHPRQDGTMDRVSRPILPNPDRGVFETFLVVEGTPIELDAHLARLEASVAVLFGATLTEETRAAVEEHARGMSLGRLRVTLAPDGGEGRLREEIVTADVDPALVFPSPERAVAAHSVVIEGGLGSHKWADRDLIAEAESRFDAGMVPIIVDRGGVVLEASRANVFAIRGETLVTPPADGRLLPGIARRRVMEAADACGLLPLETELTIEDLVAADEVLLAGSVRGVEPVRAVDGNELSPPSGAGIRVAAELRRGWMPSPANAR